MNLAYGLILIIIISIIFHYFVDFISKKLNIDGILLRFVILIIVMFSKMFFKY